MLFKAVRQTDGRTDRQPDRQTDRQSHRQTGTFGIPLGTLERASKLKTVHEIWLAKVTSGWNSL